MLSSEFKERDNPILIPNMDADTFQTLLKYVVSNKLEKDENECDMVDLYMAAHQYQMEQLLHDCIDILKNIIKTKDAARCCSTFRGASRINTNTFI